MNFYLTADQSMIRDMVRNFSVKELKPGASQRDRNKEFPSDLVRQMAKFGLMGMNIPVELGGSQAGVVAYSLALTEIGRGDASAAVTMSVNNMVAEVIHEFGSEELQRRYIPRLCSGEAVAGSFALTESGAGSDASGLKTSAKKDGNEYILNGEKIFITSAEYAAFFIVWAVTDQDAPKGRGISAFIVDADTPGIEIGKAEEKLGQCASATNPLVFTDCRVPADQILGEKDLGFRIAMRELDGGRIGIGSMAVGIGLEAMDYAVHYAQNRIQFDRPIAEFQGIQWMIADSYTDLNASQLLLLKAAFLKEQGDEFTKEASMGKLSATEAANRACYNAMQILGGYGYSKEYPVERLYRDVRVTTIYEGTSEIQRMVIAREMLRNVGKYY